MILGARLIVVARQKEFTVDIDSMLTNKRGGEKFSKNDCNGHCKKMFDYSLNEVGSVMNLKNRNSVSACISEMNNCLSKDSALYFRYESILLSLTYTNRQS